MGRCQQVLATFFKNLLLGTGEDVESTAIRLDFAAGDVGQPDTVTRLETRGGVGVTNQSIDVIGELVTLDTKGLDKIGEVETVSISFHSLDGLELEGEGVDLGLDGGGGVRVHLHRGNTIVWERVTVKHFSQFFLFFLDVDRSKLYVVVSSLFHRNSSVRHLQGRWGLSSFFWSPSMGDHGLR